MGLILVILAMLSPQLIDKPLAGAVMDTAYVLGPDRLLKVFSL